MAEATIVDKQVLLVLYFFVYALKWYSLGLASCHELKDDLGKGKSSCHILLFGEVSLAAVVLRFEGKMILCLSCLIFLDAPLYLMKFQSSQHQATIFPYYSCQI